MTDWIGVDMSSVADRIAEYVARVVAEAPPLSESQKAKLANLLGADPR